MGKAILMQDNKVALEIKPGQHLVFHAKAGKKYQLIQDSVKKNGNKSDIIAVKKGAHLVLLMPDNTELIIENFYLDCAGNQCSIQTNEIIITSQSGSAGAATGDNTLVYAEGDVDTLLDMSRGNPSLINAISQHGSQNGHLSINPEAASNTPDTLNKLGSVSSVVGGPGIAVALAGVGVAAVAGASAGGGGGGSNNSSSTSSVKITSPSRLKIQENVTEVSTLKASQRSVVWSFDTSGDATSYADNSLFNIDSTTGALTFKAAPNYESVTHGHDYSVKVKASYSYVSGGALKTTTDTKSLTIQVSDVINELRPSITIDSAIINDAATQAELSNALLTLNAINQDNGNASIALPNNYSAVITLKQGKNIVTKEVAGSGIQLIISLTSAEVSKLGDGTVSINVVSKDSAGNTSIGSNASFKLNTLAPTISSAIIQNIPENQQTIATLTANETVTWALDNSGTNAALYADNGKFSINSATGVLTWTSANGADFETPASSLTTNAYKLTVVATDLAGNKTLQNLTVNVSNIINEAIPTITLSSYVSGNISSIEAVDVRGMITLTNVPVGAKASLTFTDSAGNTVSKDSAISVANSSLTVNLTSAELARLSNGNISVTAVSIDANNNRSLPSTVLRFVLDKDAPSILGTGIIRVKENQNAIATINANESVTWALDTSGTDSAVYGDNSLFSINANTGALTWANSQLGNYEWRGNLPYKLRISATDIAGNTSTQNIVLTLEDIPQVEATPLQALSSFVQDAVSTREATQSQGLVELSNIANGNSAKVTFSNASGNTVIKTSATYAGNRLGIALSQSDLNSLGNGNVTVSSISYDAAGNSSVKSSNLIFTLDNTSPEITSSATLSNNENNNTVATLSATDNSSLTWALDVTGTDANVYADNSLFTINSSSGILSWASGSGRDFDSVKSAANNSLYQVRIAATDLAGNKTTQNLTVNLVNLNENPSVSNAISASTVTINADSALPDIALNDPDNGDILHVRLVASSGTIKIPNVAGLTNTGGISGSSTVNISGTLDKINEGLKQATINTSNTSTITISYGDAAAGDNNFPFSTTLTVSPIANPIVTDFNVTDNVGNTAFGIAAQALNFTVNFSQAINVTGTPTLTFQVGSNASHTVTASYLSGSGTNTLTFSANTGAPLTSNGSLRLRSINTDNSNTLSNNGVAVSTDLVNQTSTNYSVDTTAPTIGYMAKQYHALNLLFGLNTSSETEANRILDNYFSESSSNAYRLSATQLATFSALAGVYNSDSSRYTGGEYLGSGYWALPSTYVAEYARAMVNLQVGQMTAVPIRTQFGWHFIYLQSVSETASSDTAAAVDILVKENIANSESIITFTSSEVDAIWSLEGADAALFNISNGALRFNTAPNFESPSDNGANNVYNLAVTLTDRAGNVSKRQITVNVADDIAGETTASVAITGANNNQTSAGNTLTATDSQTGTGGQPTNLSATWRWQSQGLDGVWNDIDGATNNSYVLATSQTALAVRSVATYTTTDGQVYRAYSNPVNVAIAPTVTQSLQDVLAQNGQAFSWTLPANTFNDYDALSYSVSGLSGTGLSFNSNTRTISGTLTSASNLSINVTATDTTNQTANSSFLIKPVTGPYIKGFSTTDTVAAYKTGASGEPLSFNIQFSESVNIANATTLTFQVGTNPAHTITATYSAGSGSNSVTFIANSGAPANSSGTLTLIGIASGSISASNGNTPLATQFNQIDQTYTVDTSAPTATVALTGATSKTGSWLNAGDTVTGTVTFNEDVLIYGTPQLSLWIGSSTVNANYVANTSTSKILNFSYTIMSGQTDSDGIAISGLNLNGGSIKNLAGIEFSGVSSAGNNGLFMVDTTSPTAVTITLNSSLTSYNVNRTEALTSGLIRIDGVNSGETAELTISRSANNSSVIKSYTGDGNQISVDLSAIDLATLGNGTINLSVVKKDVAGNTSPSSTNSFILDTLAPSSPMLSLAANISDGASSTEAKSATGVVNLWAESGSNISVVLSKGVASINKSYTSSGSNIAVTLTDSDLTSLGTGEVSLSAIATDSAGNSSYSSLINFNVI